jgi:hypothetical protein
MALAAIGGCCLLAPTPLRAQINESMLPTWAQQTWDPGIPGGIPADTNATRPATVWLPSGNPYNGYSVNPALAGSANAAAFTTAMQNAINSAIAAATPTHREIVFLAPGSYFVNPQTDPDGSGAQVGLYVRGDDVTIRGSGSTQTSIVATSAFQSLSNGYGTLILIGHRYGSADSDFVVENVTADALKGSTTVQVANASSYVVGDVITIDHQDGAASLDPGGVAELNDGFIWIYDDQYFQRQPSGSFQDGPDTGAPAFGSVTDMASANANAVNVMPTWRTIQQMDQITAINGNTLTLEDPLNMDFPLALNPQVWRTVPLNTASLPVGNQWDGLENIRVAGGSDMWEFPGGVVGLSFAAYSWIENVDADGEYWSSDPTDHPGKYGDNIGLGHCYRCQVTGSYSHGSLNEAPDNTGHNGAYGIDITTGSSQCLIDNNISINNDKPVVLRNSGGGNVIAYNYVDDSQDWDTPGWLESGIDASHAAFDHSNLFEGNWANNLGNDGTHGAEGDNVYLRNYSNGNNSSQFTPAMTSDLRAVSAYGYDYHDAYLGNVLEQTSTAEGALVYEVTPSSTSGTPIYELGYIGGSTGWDDGYSANEIWLDGNWDNFHASQKWPNGTVTIPSSFYLTSAPAYFSGYTWPWVNPATGATSTLPAMARYNSGNPVPQPGPDFSISASPSSQTVTAGGGTSYSVSVSPVDGYAGTVNLTAGGLPSGASAVFSPASISGGSGGSTMSVSTTTATAAGTYTVTITGTDSTGSPTHATAVTLIINAAAGADFALSATPSSQTVTAGSGTSYTVSVSPENGYAGTVNLTAGGLPSGASAVFSPASISGGSGSATMSVSTTSATAAGTYTVTITGKDSTGSPTHATPVTLIVNAAGGGGTGIQQVQTVQTDYAGGSSSFTSNSITTSSGDLLVAEIAVYNWQGVPDITSINLDGTTSFTIADDVTPAGGGYRLVLATLPNVAAGTHTLTVTANGNMLNAVVIASEFSGVATASPVDGAGASANGYGYTPSSGTFTTTNGNDLWVAAFVGGTSTTSVTPGSGWTVPANGAALGSGSAFPECGFEYEVANNQTSGAGSFTITSEPNWSAVAIALKPASGGGGGGGGGGGIAFDQTVQTDYSSGSSSFTSNSITTSGGDLLVAEVALYNWQGVPDITSIKLDGTTSLTINDDLTPAGGGYRLVLATLPNVTAGTHTLTVTANGNMLNAVLIASEFSGVATSSPVDGAGASANGYGYTPNSGTFTATNGNDLWVAAFVGGTSTTSVTAGSGWTVPANGAALAVARHFRSAASNTKSRTIRLPGRDRSRSPRSPIGARQPSPISPEPRPSSLGSIQALA